MLEQATSVLVAVGEDDDPPGGVVGKAGEGKLDRAPKVGVFAVDGALDSELRRKR